MREYLKGQLFKAIENARVTRNGSRQQDLELARFDAAKEGMIAGIEAYAWWKDGVQYVGTTGKTLKQAIAEVQALKDVHL